jgi:hypothetical protein
MGLICQLKENWQEFTHNITEVGGNPPTSTFFEQISGYPYSADCLTAWPSQRYVVIGTIIALMAGGVSCFRLSSATRALRHQCAITLKLPYRSTTC